MFFKTPLVFGVVAAISASVMSLLGGMTIGAVYRCLLYFAVIPSVPHLTLLSLGILVVIVFALTLPIETLYARRVFFSENRFSCAHSNFLLFPFAVAVVIYSKVIDWRRGQ
jgi:hypothetical protein